MQVRYTFKIRGHLKVDCDWLYKRANWIYQFDEADGYASSISVTIPNVAPEHWPEVIQHPEPGIRAQINIRDPHAWFVTHDINNIAGFLGLFGVYDIETDAVQVNWIPESQAERDNLSITRFERSFATSPPDPEGPLPKDLIARVVMSAWQSDDNQIPLCFFRRGIEDLHNHRYVESFYDFYFIFETLFANGKSSPSKVLKEYLASAEFRLTVDDIFVDHRDMMELKQIDMSKCQKYIEPRDGEILFKFLIETRGWLHHHSMKQSRPSMKWDPKDQSPYRFEATLGALIAFRLCMKRVQDQLWQGPLDVSQIAIFRREEHKMKIRIVYSALSGGMQLHDQEAILEVEGQPDQHGIPSPDQLLKAEHEFRSRFNRRYLISYESGPADGSPGRFSDYRAYLPLR